MVIDFQNNERRRRILLKGFGVMLPRDMFWISITSVSRVSKKIERFTYNGGNRCGFAPEARSTKKSVRNFQNVDPLCVTKFLARRVLINKQKDTPCFFATTTQKR